MQDENTTVVEMECSVTLSSTPLALSNSEGQAYCLFFSPPENSCLSLLIRYLANIRSEVDAIRFFCCGNEFGLLHAQVRPSSSYSDPLH